MSGYAERRLETSVAVPVTRRTPARGLVATATVHATGSPATNTASRGSDERPRARRHEYEVVVANERGQRVTPRPPILDDLRAVTDERCELTDRIGVWAEHDGAATRSGGCDRGCGDGEIALAAVSGEILGVQREDDPTSLAASGQHG